MKHIRQLESLQDITTVVNCCADYLYDQSNGVRQKLSELASKFANFAIVYAAYDGANDLSGYVAFYANNVSTKLGYISIIVVKKECQGKGIGSFLFSHVVDHLKEKNFLGLQLEVAKGNKKALNFYLKKDFAIIEERATSYLLQLLF